MYPTNSPPIIAPNTTRLIGTYPENINKNVNVKNPNVIPLILKIPDNEIIANIAIAVKYVASPENIFMRIVCKAKGSVNVI